MRILVALAVLSLGATGFSQAPEADPASVTPTSAPSSRSSVPDDDLGAAAQARRSDPTLMVCRRTQPRAGSRVVRDRGDRRICMTQEEWDRQAELGRESLKERDRGTCGGAGGCTFGRY